MSTPPVARTPSILARACLLVGLSLAALAIAPRAASAQFAPSDGVFGDPAVVSYRLTSEKLDSFVAAVYAIDALSDSGAMDGLSEVEDDAELSEVVAALDADPAVREALAGAGMSSQEYVTFMLALVRAMFGSMPVQIAGEAGYDEITDEVLRENVRFYLANEAVFEQLGEEDPS